MLLSDMECPALQLVRREDLGIALESRGEQRAVQFDWQFIAGQEPRPSTNYKLGQQTWKILSSLGSFFIDHSVSPRAENVYKAWALPSLHRVKFLGRVEDFALNIPRIVR